MVGRDGELAQLQRAWRAGGQMLTVCGRAGVGKSRLVRELADWAQTREWAAPMLEQLPPIAARNARETGTDVVGYLTESFGFSVFVLDGGAVYQTYSAGSRGVEFLMGYYAILDRAPKGRDEDDGFQLWIRRHDEYDA